LQRDPQPAQLKLPYIRATNDFAETVGSTSAIGQEIVTGENVPRTQDLSRTKNLTTDSENDSEEEDQDDEWDNYWPPSPPTSDTEDDDEEETLPESESDHLVLGISAAQQHSTSHLVLSPDRDLLRTVTNTPTISARIIPSTSVDCPLSPSTDQMEMTKTDEALTTRNLPVQVFVRRGQDAGAFEISKPSEHWACVNRQWGIAEQDYESPPRLDLERSDVEYFLVRRKDSSGLEHSRINRKTGNIGHNSQK
jgi:hypothetical protein